MEHLGDARRLGKLSEPRRNNYFYGKLLDELHFRMEQDYFNGKRWLLNRLILGEGVVCGLDVTIQDGKLCMTPGVAIDALGREIVVPAAVCIDPWTVTDDCGQPTRELSKNEEHEVYLCLAYKECAADFTPVLVTDCNTPEQCTPGTIVESFCLLVRETKPPTTSHEGEPPALPDRPKPELCSALINGVDSSGRREDVCKVLSTDPCAIPSENPCVVLAGVTLKDDGTIGNEADEFDRCSHRPVVYSNAVLFDLILCLAERIEECCGQTKKLEKVSGDNQTAPVKGRVSDPLIVRVLENGVPVANERVVFEVEAGGGQIGAEAANLSSRFETLSMADGKAQLPFWNLGPNPGENRTAARIAAGAPAKIIFQATAKLVDVILPVVTDIWPTNGAALERADAERLISDTGGLKLTFNREMNGDNLGDPDPWLGLWLVRSTPSGFVVREVPPSIRVFRIGLIPRGPVPTRASSTVSYKLSFPVAVAPDQLNGLFFLVVIRAAGSNIADTASVLLDADFAGTALDFTMIGLSRESYTVGLIDALWNVPFDQGHEFSPDLFADKIAALASLPATGSGNGTPGGLFHSWFAPLPPEGQG